MKILALLTDGVGGYGGIAQYNRDFVRALASLEGVGNVLVLPRSDGVGPAELPDPKVVHLPPIGGRLRYSLRALRVALGERPDVIFCGHLFMAPLAWLLSKVLRVRWWLQIHGIEAWDRPGASPVTGKDSFPAWFPIREMAESADLVTSVSRYTRRRFLGWASVTPEKVRVLPNTYDVPAPAAASKEELKRRHGLEGRELILTVSRIDQGDRYKGHDKVIRALPQLLETHPKLAYVIVGEGDNRAELERLAGHVGMRDHVRFVGRVDRAELSEYYRMADAFVMPSTKEGFGIVFLEAAAYGLPVVAGNRDGSVDACGEGVIGACIDPDSVQALVSVVNSALAAPGASNPQVSRFSRTSFRDHVAGIVNAFQPARAIP